jgi:hypothetical protein
MRPTDALDLDHTIPLAHNPRSVGDRIVHAKCNRRAGAFLRTPRLTPPLEPQPFPAEATRTREEGPTVG